MIKELLPPNNLTQQLEEKLKQLKSAQAQLTKSQKNQPEGHLRIAQKGSGRPLFYHYTSPDDLKGKYLQKKQTAFAKALAQKDYNAKLLKLLEKEITALQNYLQQTALGQSITNLYESLCPARQQLVTPATLTDKQYEEEWQKVIYQGKHFAPDSPEFYTAQGERVRSKSEVIIADTLFRHNIPYRYEYPITLNHNGNQNFHSRNLDSRIIKNSPDKCRNKSITLYPDFLCLNLRTRAEFIWEHFGLIDNPEYAQAATKKLNFYAENSIFPGHNLILTMETQNEPLSTFTISKIIEQYLV